MAGQMSAGQMAQFILYAVFTAGAVGALSEVWGELQRAAGATERLAELLAVQDPVAEPADPRPPADPAKGRVEFDAVTFAYSSRPEVSARNDVWLVVEPGEPVGPDAPSGAGTTTI